MKRFSIIFTFFIIVTLSLNAQDGKQQRITGKVTDAATGQSLPGVNILIEGTTTGTVTNLTGEYSIMVRGSESVLVFSFISFTPLSIKVGDQRTINVNLKQDLQTLDEVVITTQAKGQIGARQQQINSNTLVNVVAPDRLQENPDANAVEAIGRLPGISVLRSGGEGSQIVIRGLEPRYTTVTLEGLNLPSSSSTTRGTNIGGISQYILQGVEVYKALTPDMEANSVGGTVNMKLQDTPEGLHYNVMAQGGYNNLNSSYGNYKLMAEISNRVFDNKLGIFFSASAESVDRGTQTMSAGYDFWGEDTDLYITGTNLNIINRINSRKSATLSMDYQILPSTKLKLYSLYSYSNIETTRQSKSYGHIGVGSVGYSMAYNPVNESILSHTVLTGETNTDFLNMEIDYGLAYSLSTGNDPDSRSWAFSFAEVSSDANTTLDMRSKYPSELIPLYTDSPDSLHNTTKGGFNSTDIQKEDKNMVAYMNLKIPFSIGSSISGNVKFGGKYRKKERFLDVLAGSQGMHPFHAQYWYEAMPWLVMSERSEDEFANHTLEGFEDHNVTDFLGGEYDYGTYFNFDKLNATSDWWESFSDSLALLGQEVWLPIVGDVSHLGYRQSLAASMINDQKIVENYYASYLMSEINIGRWIMFMPGFRYEQTDAIMEGFEAMEPLYTPSTIFPLVGKDTTATRADDFFLPMIHLRIKPSKFAYLHLAYTQTISRPDFNSISPNLYINPGSTPFQHRSQNPQLRAELWTNFDAQITFHSNKVGLFSISGFYKTVQDKIWFRSYDRLKGDDVVEPFGENDLVRVSLWENHPYEVMLRGAEFEWQTSFWYLPGILKYFTLSLNYTNIYSRTSYPTTRIDQIIPPEGGRPVTVRIDSVISGPMLSQPKHIANASLGFNYKRFNTWLSYQYNGDILTSKNYNTDVKDGLKSQFYRMDLQMTYDIPLKIPGDLQLIGNFANLTNVMEESRLRGDPRFTYQEAYGWTADMGLRYKF